MEEHQVKVPTIAWKDSEPDLAAQQLGRLLKENDWTCAVALIRNVLKGIRVYLLQDCQSEIDAHLASDRHELGGLLLGQVFEADLRTDSPYPWITIVVKSLPSKTYLNSPVSLRMETELWTRASSLLQEGLMVVGWYHSHPNLGAFFSGVDRATQAAFFNHPYSLGVVIDPIQNQRRCFFGGQSQELDTRALATV